MTRVAVIGAGLTGLAAAYRLAQQGLDVMVFESADRAGGVVRSTRQGGFLTEAGPNSFAAPSSAVAALIAELGLDAHRIAASPAARNRYIVRRGALVAVPASPRDLLASPLLSVRAKARLLREPLVARAPADVDETVAAFVRRRFGGEVLDYLAGPMVGGIFAGDPEQLSLRHAFPRIAAMEQRYGSLMRAMIRGGGGGPGARRIESFVDGIEMLPAALAASLGARLRTGISIRRIGREESGWRLAGGGRGGEPSTGGVFDAVVVAAPAHRVAEMEFAMAGGSGLRILADVPHPPVTVLSLGYRRAEVAHRLDGFGVLVPAVEHRSVLGVIFSSTIFPDRAPDGHVLLTVVVGGTRRPDLALADRETLMSHVLADLHGLVGVRGTPTHRAIATWPRAIPQYAPGHDRVLRAAAAAERASAGLFFAGTYLHGVSVGDALASGLAVGDRVAMRVRRR